MTDDDDMPGFDLGDGTGAEPYVVLARKYRPESFADLIGQDAMVTTLRNAFATNRIAQGFMLTGVRGVGKTTTARILARALNWEQTGADSAPTVDFDGYGVHCRDIIKSRHPDVVEMDAASNTGVDNVREIIESARYKPMTARYKVFIIDEVHMLSKGAFNALLKTLEEPPGHVKFIFATTEVRKVPVTVLSRCQRFDLRRVDVAELIAHFQRVVDAEGARADADALAMIARAAGGSVRDGLSILDQAIAMGSGEVTAEAVRAMIGLADRGRIFDLVGLLFGGDPKAALEAFETLYRDGADPTQLLGDLADTIHAITKAKAAGISALGDDLSAAEKARADEMGQSLSMAILSRAWQMLLKGIDEVGRAPNAKAAAEMLLIRLAFTADLPTPDQLIRAMGGPAEVAAPTGIGGSAGIGESSGIATAQVTGTGHGPNAHATHAPRAQAAGGVAGGAAPHAVASPSPMAETADTGPRLESFADVIAFVGAQRDAMLKLQLEDHVRLVRFEPGRIEINPLDTAPADLAGVLGQKLTRWTGQRWIVTVVREEGADPVGAVRRRKEAEALAELKTHPAIVAVLEALPDAEIASIRDIASTAAPTTDDGDNGDAAPDADGIGPGDRDETDE